MNPSPDWKPRRPSPDVRESLFGAAGPAPRRRARRGPPWPSIGLVLALSWSGSFLLWQHGDPAVRDDAAPRAWDVPSALGLVAQNSVPVAAASFAFTNAVLPPSTNASFSGPNGARN